MTRRIIPDDNEKEDAPERVKKQIKLENIAVNPFDAWSDWHSPDGEAIITFMTMSHHLYSEWENKARRSNTVNHAKVDGKPVKEDLHINIYTHDEFESDIKGPGVYRDSTHYRNPQKVDEAYTVIVPNDFMTQKMCEGYIKKLNDKFDRNFELEEVDQQARKADMHANFAADKVDMEKEELQDLLEKVYKV